ncbi:hypothetical protein [Glaciecola sp. 1036]|uniref:hypothetical protein n=1 Tax=Alteromonadaceae TaxID=72275 RepID=UPI003D07D6A7
MKNAWFLLILVMGVYGCDSTEVNSTSNVEATKTSSESISAETQDKGSTDMFELEGKIEYKDIEGGFYAFIGKDGSKFTPFNLDAQFRQNGLVVRIKAEVMEDMMTTTQFGKLIKIHDISIVDSSRVTPVKDPKTINYNK